MAKRPNLAQLEELLMNSKQRRATAVVSVLISLGTLAQSGTSPCDLPDTGPYEKAGRLCDGAMPGTSRSQCHDHLAELAAIEDPSLDEALALAYGRSFAAPFEEDIEAAQAEAELAGREVLKPFMELTPENPMVVYAYAYFHMLEEEHYRTLLRKTLTLDPTCGSAAFFLSRTMGASDDETDIEESAKYLTHGYEHSEGTWKLLFARRKYERLIYRSAEEAEAFRDQVAADMALREFPLDPENRARSLEVLCNGNGLSLRLDAPCEKAIHELAGRDRHANAPLGDDVLDAWTPSRHSRKTANLARTAGSVTRCCWSCLKRSPSGSDQRSSTSSTRVF